MTRLAELSWAQGGVFKRSQAVEAVGRARVDAAVDAGIIVNVRGVYAFAAHTNALDANGRHLLETAARVLRSRRTAYASHESAALAHGFPLLDLPAVPTITVHTPAAATSGGVAGRYLADVPSSDRTTIRGLGATERPRTVADVCRSADTVAALVVTEGALRKGVTKDEVRAVLRRCARWPGVVAAREVLELASKWSESALESLGMHWARVQGLPVPEQQLTIRTLDGRFLARVDQLWEEHATVGELDGQIKLGVNDDVPPNSWRVVWKEKLREDGLRDVGLQVARGYWSDRDDDGAEYAARVRRQFELASRYTGPRLYVVSDERISPASAA